MKNASWIRISSCLLALASAAPTFAHAIECQKLEGEWSAPAPASGFPSDKPMAIKLSNQKKCSSIKLEMNWQQFGELPGETLKTNTGKVSHDQPGTYDLRYLLTLTEAGLRIDQTYAAERDEPLRAGTTSYHFKLRDKDTLVYYETSIGIEENFDEFAEPAKQWTSQTSSNVIGPIVFKRAK